MPGFKLLMRPSNIIYAYDGSLDGFFSCVHLCVYEKCLPLAIQSVDIAETSLIPPVLVPTDIEKAARVRQAICHDMSLRALELLGHVFLSCLKDKEVWMLRFLVLGFEKGRCVTDMMADPVVSALLDAERHLQHEAHLLTGFIRFSDFEGKLIAVIDPKNQVLPLILDHFQDRYTGETFLIYDRTHQSALIYHQGQSRIGHLEGFEMPRASGAEQDYRSLWKRFYETIAITERINPRCRMSHMPKRFWGNLTEMQE